MRPQNSAATSHSGAVHCGTEPSIAAASMEKNTPLWAKPNPKDWDTPIGAPQMAAPHAGTPYIGAPRIGTPHIGAPHGCILPQGHRAEPHPPLGVPRALGDVHPHRPLGRPPAPRCRTHLRGAAAVAGGRRAASAGTERGGGSGAAGRRAINTIIGARRDIPARGPALPAPIAPLPPRAGRRRAGTRCRPAMQHSGPPRPAPPVPGAPAGWSGAGGEGRKRGEEHSQLVMGDPSRS